MPADLLSDTSKGLAPTSPLRVVRKIHIAITIATCLIVQGAPVRAQAPAVPPGRWIEAGGLYHVVSNDLGDWTGAYARAVLPVGARDVWYADMVAQKAFHDRGEFASVTNRHEWNKTFFTMISAGAGAEARFFPQVRSDASVGFKWGKKQNILTAFGGSFIQSQDTLRDVAATTSTTIYLEHGVVIEGGLRFNVSTPGSVKALRGYLATTVRPSTTRSFAVRVGAGSEGWQLISTGQTFRRFQSQEGSVEWREVVTPHWGTVLHLETYHNPYYSRTGINFGLARYF